MTVGHAEAQGAGHAKHVNDNSSAATDTRMPQTAAQNTAA
jgi:hypothetical protein